MPEGRRGWCLHIDDRVDDRDRVTGHFWWAVKYQRTPIIRLKIWFVKVILRFFVRVDNENERD
jgi:hypothetical protein